MFFHHSSTELDVNVFFTVFDCEMLACQDASMFKLEPLDIGTTISPLKRDIFVTNFFFMSDFLSCLS